MEKIVWIRADIGKDIESRKRIVTTALENNFTQIIIKPEDKKIFKKLGKIDFITILNGEIKINNKNGKIIPIANKSDQENVLSLAGKFNYVIVNVKNWKIIPLENLIAAYNKTKSKLLVEVTNTKEAKTYLEALELGVDGVILNSTNIKTISQLRNLVEGFQQGKLELISAEITKIKTLGTGDRVCIDTCSILIVGEGMLIGSQSNGLFLVHSESIESEYVDSRPFRVNAGPVHAYILGLNDKTKYLSDLNAGDEVLAVDINGNTRPVIIGRVKIEKRPLILIEVKYKKNKFNIILQNAETIRLISEKEPVSIVNLKVGNSILLWVDESGRHFGMKVQESIVEK